MAFNYNGKATNDQDRKRCSHLHPKELQEKARLVSNLADQIKAVQAILADDSPIELPAIKPEEPLLSDEDAQLLVSLTAQRYLEGLK